MRSLHWVERARVGSAGHGQGRLGQDGAQEGSRSQYGGDAGMMKCSRRGSSPTALFHHALIVTRNEDHFRPTGVEIINHWKL
jgi:hypothetical protein